ncbi:MAG: glycosyltransferase family 39 protein [Acidobacteria bacterium]|nr:glycosyltransferase family 39 protein [Acidobacteriota bacterium]
MQKPARQITPPGIRSVILSTALLAALLTLCWLYYLPALDQFFSQDDFPLLASSRPGPGWPQPRLFWFMGSVREYRPLTQHFYFYANQRLFDLDPRAHHAMNLAVHLANVLMVYTLGRRWLQTLAGAFFAAVFYGFHPIHFYEIYWVSGISQLGFVFCSLVGLLLVLKFKDSNQWRYQLLAFIAAAGAFLSKEDAIVLPALMTLLLWEGRTPGARTRWGILAVWLLLPAYFVWRMWILGFGLPSEGVYQFGAGLFRLTEKLFRYGEWLLGGRFGLAALILLLAFAFRLRSIIPHSRQFVFLSLLTIFPMLPSFLVPSASEHYLNLPVAGLGMLLASIVEARSLVYRQTFLFAVATVLFLISAALKTNQHLKNTGWGIPVPAKAEACRQLFNQIRQTAIPPECEVQLRYPPIEPWEKNWLIFLPKLARDRPDLKVSVVAPSEPPPPTSGCNYVWEWGRDGWKLK